MKEKKAEEIFDNITKIIEKEIGHENSTYSSELNRLGKELFDKKFIGVFSSDKIPQLKDNSYAIINLDRSDQGGSHWIALAKKDKDPYIFDSFGRDTYKILPSIRHSGNGLIKMTDNDRNQKDHENNCGQKCIAWLCVFDEYGPSIAKLI